MGVITNSDNRTADILTSLGVRVNPLHYGEKPSALTSQKGDFDIDFTVLSYDVGAEKPDKRIFTAAEEMLGGLLEAEQQSIDLDQWSKVYVGDEYDKDVVGATDAGWRAILVDRETAGRGKDVEWLDDDQPVSLFDILARVKAVGFSSLAKLAEWVPSKP